MERFKLPPLFRSGAVLCRNKEIRVFGEAEENARLTLILQDGAGAELARDEAVAREGRFCFRLPPQKAQTDCTLTLSDGESSVS